MRLRTLRTDDPALIGNERGLHAIARPDLDHDARHVPLDGCFGQEQPAGNFRVGQARANQRQDIMLATAQGADSRLRAVDGCGVNATQLVDDALRDARREGGGAPQILILDEPMNGLDAEGIAWMRQFMKNRAAQGGTVFVSSHLMSEVQQVSDQLVLIGRGELITQAPTDELIKGFAQQVITVRAPQASALAGALAGHGAEITEGGGNRLEISGLSLAEVGAIAFSNGFELHELSQARGSLESAYDQLTRDTVEFTSSTAGTVMGK